MDVQISIKVGTLSKTAIKTKNCNLLNHFYLTDKSTEKTFSVFSLKNKKLGQGQNKTEKVTSNTVLGRFHNEQFNQ